jgi:hypothetical protein
MVNFKNMLGTCETKLRVRSDCKGCTFTESTSKTGLISIFTVISEQWSMTGLL